jgi:hypothetical protein
MLATSSTYSHVFIPLSQRKGRGKVAKISPLGRKECREILISSPVMRGEIVQIRHADTLVGVGHFRAIH